MSRAIRRSSRAVRGTLLFASVASIAPSTLFARATATWIADVGSAGGNWSDASNWVGGVVADGGSEALFSTLPKFTSRPVTIFQDLPTITVSGITFDGYVPYELRAPANAQANSITLIGPANLYLPLPTPNTTGIGQTGQPVLVPLAGTAGLLKTGPGTLTLRATNTYSGGTKVAGGVLNLVQVGDLALGTGGGSVTLDGGTVRVMTTAWNTSREIHLLGNGTIEAGSSNPSSIVGGASGGGITGPGSLYKAGTWGLLVQATCSYTGGTNVMSGSLTLMTRGALTSTSSLLVRDSLVLDNVDFNNTDRVNDAAPVTLAGASVTFNGNFVANSSETIGDVTFSRGLTTISIVPSTAVRASITAGDVTRHNGATLFARGTNLGAAPGPNVASLFFASAPSLIGGGGAAGSKNVSIIPWAVGNTNATAAINAASNSFLTYTANGVRPLDVNTEYVTSLSAATLSTNNVRLSSPETLSPSRTINSLIVAGAFTYSVGGGSTLTIGSGALMNVANGTIQFPINFGAAEGILHAQANLSLEGIISGSGGLTKQGIGVATLSNSSNNYTGRTIVGGGRLVFSTDIPNGGPSQLGNSTSPILIAPAGTGTIGTSGTVARLVYGGASATTATLDRNVVVSGRMALNNVQVLPGLGVMSAATLTMNGNILLDDSPLTFVGVGPVASSSVIVNGIISGTGTNAFVSDAAALSNAITLNGNNTFEGGTEMVGGGRWNLGSDAALGTGSVRIAPVQGGAPTITAVGGARVIPNEVVAVNSLPTTFWTISGSQDITFTGSLNFNGGNQTHTINNTGLTTYAGVLHSGGFTKAGGGTLVLSASNAFTGNTTINGGVLRVVNSNALGSPQAPTFITNGGALQLANDSLTSEPVVATGVGAATERTIRNLSGNNRLADVTLLADTTVNAVAGTLSVGNVDSTTAADIVKTGAAELTARRLRFDNLYLNEGTVHVALGREPLDKVSTLAFIDIAGGATPTATLDLGDNDLVTSATDATMLAAQIRNARNAGAWDQPGLSSSAARSQPDHATGLGLLTSTEYMAESGNGTFDGAALVPSSAIVKYTWNGDANLDGRITFDDYVKIDTGFNSGLSGWLNGDFNYDGVVNFDDYVLIDVAFNAQNGTLGRAIDWVSGEDRSDSGGVEIVVDHFGQFGLPYAQAFLAAVPEPTNFALLAAVGFLGRRGRRRARPRMSLTP